MHVVSKNLFDMPLVLYTHTNRWPSKHYLHSLIKYSLIRFVLLHMCDETIEEEKQMVLALRKSCWVMAGQILLFYLNSILPVWWNFNLKILFWWIPQIFFDSFYLNFYSNIFVCYLQYYLVISYYKTLTVYLQHV